MAHAEAKKMSTNTLQIVCFFALLICCYGQQHPSCKIWQTMARHLSSQPKQQMTCFSNDTDTCTSLRCSGTYKYTSWLLPDSKGIEVDYCFGMRLNHCENPVTMDIYMIVPSADHEKMNISYQKTISHNTQIKIPGFTFSLKNLGTVDVFLYFHMVRNANVVDFAITAKVRITSIGSLVMWPSSMQKQIVPNENIPVPPCNYTTPSTTPPAMALHGSCHPPTWHAPTSAPGISTTTANPFIRPSAPSLTYNKTCNEETKQCGLLEACNLAIGRCQCDVNFNYDPKGKVCYSKNRLGQRCSADEDCGAHETCNGKLCVCRKGFVFVHPKQMCYPPEGPATTTAATTVTNQPHAVTMANQQPTSASPTNKIAIIAGGVVGGVVFLVLVVLLVFFIVRRMRRPYQNREMLLSDENDGIM